MKIHPLPPLNSLVVFEAAARNMSFTRAAEELHVTQGAVSRQIRLLEERLQTELFVRNKQTGLKLTPDGAEYLTQIKQALMDIAQATRRISSRAVGQPITLVTTNAMASFWLLPRCAEFQERYPDIPLRILAADSLQQLHEDEFDIALFYCRTPPHYLKKTPLFCETVFPVCSPAYLEKRPELAESGDLSGATLLDLEVDQDWLGWDEWFRESGWSSGWEAIRRLKINNYPLVIQAALNGQGVALAWENLVDDYLESGLLVKPVDTSLVTSSQFYMLEPDKQEEKSGVYIFRQWLLSFLAEECENN